MIPYRAFVDFGRLRACTTGSREGHSFDGHLQRIGFLPCSMVRSALRPRCVSELPATQGDDLKDGLFQRPVSEMV